MNILPVSAVNITVTKSEIFKNALQAQRIEQTTWNGISASAAYYENTDEKAVVFTLSTGKQLVYVDGLLEGSSDCWSIEKINGEFFTKYDYPNAFIYTSEHSQFYVRKD